MTGLKLKSENGNFLIKGEKFSSVQVKEAAILDVQEKKTGILEFSIASDEPYERWWGTEVLSHKEGAVNLVRLNNSANILYNHNRDDYIAVCLRGWIQDGKTRVETLWNLENPDYALPRRIYEDVNAGILKNSSVGYEINEITFKDVDKNHEIGEATLWTPFEGSIVTVPADYTTGVGRAKYFDLGKQENHPGHQNQKNSEDSLTDSGVNWEELTQKINQVTDTVNNFISEVKNMGDEENSSTQTLEVTREEDISNERERSQAIFAAGHKYNCPDLAQEALQKGWSVDQLRSQILQNQQQQKPVARTNHQPLGMNEAEKKRYSFLDAIRCAEKKQRTGFVAEIHDELVKKQKEQNVNYKDNGNVLIPVYDLGINKQNVNDVYRQMSRSASDRNYLASLYQRDQMIGSPQFGGDLVETQLLEERFIDIFRNSSKMRQMGMQSLTGLVGYVDIPKQTSGAIDGSSVYWVGEDEAVGKNTAEFGLVKFRPKNVGAYMYMTRSMLLHGSIGMENFTRRELAIALALGMDKAAIDGSGTANQPLGIVNTGGVNPIIFGADGAEPNWQKIVQFETKIAVANADERTMGWIVNAKTRGELKSREKFPGTTGQTLWQSANNMSNQGYINGYRAGVTNQIRGDYTKGTGTGLSGLIFGDFSRLICAEWGSYELAVDPYDKFLEAGLRVRIIHTCDIQVLQEKAFSVATDLATPYSDAA